MRRQFRAWSIVCALLAAPALAQTQPPSSYPDRPIRLVVAFVAGGATDTLARQISNDLKEALGQTVVVENRPGANGYLAWNHVASS
ncbi:MAG TPA: tripartite tricarboxylate transporter substrate-binding protein, partial [Xanthobacteraceae bacterium]|nr:tripartite tricarboxylate transporter substrate-binding protein [Xanthobacteraceae bacterium]